MTFQSFRNGIQQLVYRLIDPSVKWMAAHGITPNIITTLGLVGNMLAAAVFVCSALIATQPCLWHIGVAGCIILLSSIMDMVDGYMARTQHKESTFGAFYDSVLDRYCELFTLAAIAFYFIQYGQPVGMLITLLALIGSIMVSYIRARAEGIGTDCKVGLLQRPERVVLTSLGAILTAFFGHLTANPLLILLVSQAIIAVLANYTAVVRILHVRNNLKA